MEFFTKITHCIHICLILWEPLRLKETFYNVWFCWSWTWLSYSLSTDGFPLRSSRLLFSLSLFVLMMLTNPWMTDTEKNAGDKWGNAFNSHKDLMSQSRLQTPHWQGYIFVVICSHLSRLLFTFSSNNSHSLEWLIVCHRDSVAWSFELWFLFQLDIFV